MRPGDTFPRPGYADVICRVVDSREPAPGVEVVLSQEQNERGDYVIVTLYDGVMTGTSSSGPFHGTMANGFYSYVDQIRADRERYLRHKTRFFECREETTSGSERNI